MVIRIKKKLYFKPRLCPDCGKPCFFCKCHLSQRCKRCHKKHDNWKHHKKSHIKRRAIEKIKYNKKYKRMRKRLIREHPYCALCGSEIRLTVHHVGGGCEHYTVLCDDCHQAYERWNNKRKVIRCRKKILIGDSNLWKNTMRTVRFHCLMYYYRIRLRLALEPPEARLAFVSSASGNTTN